MTYTPDPTLDLVLERVVDVPPHLVWRAWTEPEHLVRWFAPRPYETIACEIDLRPGGIFHTVMRSPDGDEMPGTGCILEAVTDERLVWTSTLGPDFRPNPPDELPFTAMVLLQPEGGGTRYTAIALHRDPEGRARHDEMGFVDGWGAALDQLVEVATAL